MPARGYSRLPAPSPRAHVQLTALKHSNKHTHFAEFMRMAEWSGWPVEVTYEFEKLAPQ
jgi:hypothetical protein